MKPERPLKHFLLAFLLALVCYAVCYTAIEHRRARNGPWQVAFTNDSAGVSAVLINEPRLGITNVQITFPGSPAPSTNAGVLCVFSRPRTVPYAVPFGECVFMDTTFLPGTVTFHLFGHEIELLPRVLLIDKREHPWVPNDILSVEPET